MNIINFNNFNNAIVSTACSSGIYTIIIASNLCFLSLLFDFFLFLSLLICFSRAIKLIIWGISCYLLPAHGLHIGPSLQHNPAPAHRPFQEPHWLRLIFSSIKLGLHVRMCIQHSARFVVKFPERYFNCISIYKMLYYNTYHTTLVAC